MPVDIDIDIAVYCTLEQELIHSNEHILLNVSADSEEDY